VREVVSALPAPFLLPALKKHQGLGWSISPIEDNPDLLLSWAALHDHLKRY